MTNTNNNTSNQAAKLVNDADMKVGNAVLKMTVIFCLAFTYCAFILGHFLSDITITHKFEGNNGRAKLDVEHSLSYNSRLKLEVDNAGTYSLPFKIEVKNN